MTVSSIQPRSFGKDLLTNEAHFGELTDSSELLDRPQELRKRLRSDGYLFLRGFFSRESVLRVRMSVIEKMRGSRLIADSTDPLEAVALRALAAVSTPELVSHNKVIYGNATLGCEWVESSGQRPESTTQGISKGEQFV